METVKNTETFKNTETYEGLRKNRTRHVVPIILTP